MNDPSETPWAIVQRMRSEGAGLGPIVAALQAKGLSREDVEVLLDGAPELTKSRDAASAQAAVIKRNPPAVLAPVDFSSVLPWSGVVGALIAGMFGAGVGGAGGWAVAGIAAVAFAALLRSELRKGLVRTLRALGFVLFGTMLLPLMSASWSTVGVVHFVAAGVALASAAMVAWSYSRGDPLKGVRNFSIGLTVYEENDVQFAVKLPERPRLGPGEHFDVVVTAQCCVDAPRELVVEIDADAQSVDGERTHRFSLSPGVVVEHTIPVRVGPLAPRFSDVIAVISCLGKGGTRVQLSSGADWVNPKRAVLTNLIGGLQLALQQDIELPLSSDGQVRLEVDTSRPIATVERRVEVRTLFTPTAEELAKAAKT